MIWMHRYRFIRSESAPISHFHVNRHLNRFLMIISLYSDAVCFSLPFVQRSIIYELVAIIITSTYSINIHDMKEKFSNSLQWLDTYNSILSTTTTVYLLLLLLRNEPLEVKPRLCMSLGKLISTLSKNAIRDLLTAALI